MCDRPYNVFLLWGCLLLQPILFAQDSSAIHTLYQKLSSTKHDTAKVDVYISIAAEYLYTVPDSAEALCNKALLVAERLNFDRGKMQALGWLAYISEQKGDIQKALQHYSVSLKLAEQLMNKKEQATILNNIAAIYKDRGLIDQALYYNRKSLQLRIALNDNTGVATSLNNIGLLYFAQSKIRESLYCYSNALLLYHISNDLSGQETVYTNIAGVYQEQADYDLAIKYYRQAYSIDRNTNDNYALAYVLNSIGSCYEIAGKSDSAFLCYRKAFQIRKRLSDKQGMAYSLKNIGGIYELNGQTDSARALYTLSLKYFKEVYDKSGEASATTKLGKLLLATGKKNEAVEMLQHSLKLSRELGYPADIQNASAPLHKYYRSEKNWYEALNMYDLYVTMRDSVHNTDARKAGIKNQLQQEYRDKETGIRAEQDKKDAVAKERLNQQKKLLYGFIIAFMIMLSSALVFFRQRNKIAVERQRSESLLLNILPEETALELKEKGHAEAKFFENVTVLLSDFKDFTLISEQMSPQRLVDELHECFSAFDGICEKHGIEKIKTVGDAYLAVCGLPVANPNHAVAVVNAAIEIREFMSKRRESAISFPPVVRNLKSLRIGIHSGHVVAGIVGEKKFAYDIWGDTVNTAARMEQNSEEGKINISEATYELVKDKFNCEYRGEIEAKNKGKLKMYFVN